MRCLDGSWFEILRVKYAKRSGLLCLRGFDLYKKFVDVLSLNLRKFLISLLEEERKFLSEFYELRNLRKGYNLKNSCSVQHETVFEPSPAFVMLTGVRKRLLPLTKREGSDSVISNNFSDTVFSRFTSLFSLKRTAFTLAEVLITIGIVGVVASLTMPSLIANYQKQQVVTQLKREYNVISNALRAAQADYGDYEEWELGQAGTIQSASDFADNYLLPYLSVLKKCGTETSGECTYEYTALNGSSGRSLAKYSRFILNDGAMIFVSTSSTSVFPKLVYINIDINGNKKPNKMGKDLFVFATTLETTQDIYKPTGRLTANGQTQTRETIKNNGIVGCSRNARGEFCSALIIKDGWTIAKDYPW